MSVRTYVAECKSKPGGSAVHYKRGVWICAEVMICVVEAFVIIVSWSYRVDARARLSVLAKFVRMRSGDVQKSEKQSETLTRATAASKQRQYDTRQKKTQVLEVAPLHSTYLFVQVCSARK